jgi:uncharacterized protein
MGIAVFLAIATLVVGSAHWFVWSRLVRDVAPSPRVRRVGSIVVATLFVVVMGGWLTARNVPRAVVAPIAWVGYTWLGFLFFLVLLLALAEIGKRVALVATRPAPGEGPPDPQRRVALSRLFGGVAAFLGAGLGTAGLANALSVVEVKKVRVVLDKLSRAGSGYRIVQVTDIHVGPTIGRAFIEDLVARVNALEPDAIAITGDLVDGSVAELREHVAPLAKLRAKDGVFFVTGNHEYYSGAGEWIAHLGTLGIRVLRNERVRVGGEAGIDLAGIDDASSRGYAGGHGPDLDKALAGRDEARPVVLLAHQPKAIHRADALGVDLQLSGHTHGGQLFPWNFLVKLQQPFVAGLHKLTRAQIYVSCGTGYWGPPMRLGAPAEITEIELVATGAPSAVG